MNFLEIAHKIKNTGFTSLDEILTEEDLNKKLKFLNHKTPKSSQANFPINFSQYLIKFLKLDFNKLKQSLILKKIAKNIVIKLPLTFEGLKACKELSVKGIKTNVTLCFSVTQALMAAKSGATYVSPFIGRLDDIGKSGVGLIQDIRKVFDNYKNLKTKILSASIRNIDHVKEVAKAGSDIATIPPKVFHEMYKHELTDKGLKIFLDDWNSTNQKIS